MMRPPDAAHTDAGADTVRVPFIKMHGLGNDFVVLDLRDGPGLHVDALLASALANRHTGIGCDQVIVLEASASASADVSMRIFNPDGSAVEACGNATRAVGRLLGRAIRIATPGGIVTAAPVTDTAGITVEMGRPRWQWDEIPLAYAMDTLAMPVGWDGLDQPVAVNVGNPHVVFFVEDDRAVPLDRLGPLIEHDPLFPRRVNVNVATVLTRDHLRLRVWERGAGLTMACGTGACATAVAAMRRGLVERRVTVSLPGGDLSVIWREDGQIVMAGPAAEAFRGSFSLADYRP